MASSITVHSVLNKISGDHLECTICFSPFKEPKMLDCLHNFCLKCLQKLKQQDPVSSLLKCPLCRHETTLNEVDDLPDNFTLSALVEEVRMQEQLLEGQGSEVRCQACEDEHPAISKCADCDRFLCQECQRAHDRLAFMKTHIIYTLGQLRSGAYKSRLREEVPKCGRHPDQNLCFYCETCERLVCTTCCILVHTKPLHSLFNLPDALDRCKQDVAELVMIAEKNKTELGIAMVEIDKSCRILDAEFQNTNEKICNLADKEVARIRDEEKTLKENVAKIYQDTVQTFQTAQAANSREMVQAESKLDDVHRLLTQGSCYEILHLKQKLLHSLRRLMGKQPERPTGSFCFEGTRKEDIKSRVLVLENGEPILKPRPLTGTESLSHGGLDGKEEWELKTDIKTFGPERTEFRCTFDVGVFSNGDVIIADNEIKQLISFSAQSSPKSGVSAQGLHIKDLTSPTRAFVNKNDQLTVLDGYTIKIFNREYQLLHQFVPDTGPGKDRAPKCFAVDDSNRIAVGYVYKKDARLSLHNPDGSLIRTVPAPMMIGDHLTICGQKLIYTNYWRKKLTSVDYTGGALFSVDVTSEMPGYWGPRGVCCDGEGGILVAVDGCSSGEIQRFDPEGRFVGYLIQGCGSPRGIAVTPAGDVAVAECKLVRIYHRSQITNQYRENESDLAKVPI